MALLLVLGPFLDLATAFSTDEGALALQVQTVNETGEWAYDHPAADFSGGEYFPYRPGPNEAAVSGISIRSIPRTS